MKKIYIPKELVGALTAATVTECDLTNPDCLSNILSPDAVAFYFKCNVMFPECLPDILQTAFQNAVDEQWLVHAKNNDAKLHTLMQEAIIDAKLESKEGQCEIPSGKLCWKIVSEELIAFWYDDSDDFAENVSKSMKTRELCADLMRSLHVVLPFEGIAATALFHEYTRINVRG